MVKRVPDTPELVCVIISTWKICFVAPLRLPNCWYSIYPGWNLLFNKCINLLRVLTDLQPIVCHGWSLKIVCQYLNLRSFPFELRYCCFGHWGCFSSSTVFVFHHNDKLASTLCFGHRLRSIDRQKSTWALGEIRLKPSGCFRTVYAVCVAEPI